MKPTLKWACLAFAICLPLSAEAHRTWMLPSSTVLSETDAWVTVDAAVSNNLFYFDHVPLRLEGIGKPPQPGQAPGQAAAPGKAPPPAAGGGRSPNKLQITAPDGSSVAPENGHVGRYRTSFDVHLTQKGTYKLAIVNSGGLLATWKENGQVRRWMGKREDLAAHVPSRASELKIGQGDTRLETFVTSGQPTETVLKPTNHGLELVPITHPNDLVAGESAEFSFLLDGKPATDLDVIVIPGSQRYRNEANELKFKTDAQGKFSVTWPSAGMYGLHADLTTPEGAVKPATERFASYSATLEVLTP
ncbi:DUF4198 domain-containing protein [Azotobacter vinelandii]|uniref:DUF4198 domain-containing protein n=1 Tax=Azotobacter vinelandii TaxID=354 RepID=UPI0007736365|nr:DUF4198 domain-containing protein [Azotobacter vinelandii]